MIIDLRANTLNEINKSYLKEKLDKAIKELHAYTDHQFEVEWISEELFSINADGLELELAVHEYTFELSDEKENLLAGMVEEGQSNYEYNMANSIIKYITSQYL